MRVYELPVEFCITVLHRRALNEIKHSSGSVCEVVIHGRSVSTGGIVFSKFSCYLGTAISACSRVLLVEPTADDVVPYQTVRKNGDFWSL
jgi:hypothetical protein